MPFRRQWLLEDRVLFVQFYDEISAVDIANVTDAHEEWLASTVRSQLIHYIVDLRQVTHYPRHISQIQTNLHTRMRDTDWMLFVTDDFFVKYIGDVFSKLLNYRFRHYSSVIEAYRFLQEIEEIPTPETWADNIDDTMPRR